MNIAFRTDATNQIGTGHFMRCLTLAEGLKDHGANIRFVSRNLPQYLSELINQKGIELVQLPVIDNDIALDELAHSKWLGISQANDAIATINALSDKDWDWLIVDHYALDTRWENSLRKSVNKIMVIDDIADRHHDCDVLLDQNYYADMETRYTEKVPRHCKLLLGPKYALLRDEFKYWRAQVKPRTGPVKRILIFFGGIDSDNYTGQTLDALKEINLEDIHIDVVIGAQHPYRSEIETVCINQSYICHVQTNNMAELMATADLAIGACGSATWERCYLGLPCIILVIAENQSKAAHDLNELGVVINLGDAKQVNTNYLTDKICELIANVNLRQDISSNALHLMTFTMQNNIATIMTDNNV